MIGFVEIVRLITMKIASIVVKNVMNPGALSSHMCRLTYPKMGSEISSP
jgi:hypothetical protein